MSFTGALGTTDSQLGVFLSLGYGGVFSTDLGSAAATIIFVGAAAAPSISTDMGTAAGTIIFVATQAVSISVPMASAAATIIFVGTAPTPIVGILLGSAAATIKFIATVTGITIGQIGQPTAKIANNQMYYGLITVDMPWANVKKDQSVVQIYPPISLQD